MSIPPMGGVGSPAASPVGAAPFAVTAPPELTLAADRTGSTSFTITNLTGRPVRARLVPRGQGGAQDSWLSVSGPTEVPMGVAATITATVLVHVPPEPPVGAHTLFLEVVAEDDTESVAGQSVSFTVPPAVVAKKKFPWWIVIVAAVVLALVVGGVIFFVNRDHGPDNPQQPGAPVNTQLPRVLGSARPGQALTSDDGKWTGDGVAFARQWQRCAASGDPCADIAGATQPTFTLSSTDTGKTIRVVVSATGSGGVTKAQSAAVGPVQAELVTVPDFSGNTFARAQLRANAAGLTVQARLVGGTCEAPTIQGQDPKAGLARPPGTTVTVFIPRLLPPKFCGNQ